MKKSYILLLFLLLTTITLTYAQRNVREVVSVTGGTGIVGNKIAEWSVGGTAVTSTMLLPNGQQLTQGFLQPSDIVIQLMLIFDPLAGKTYEDANFVLNAIASDGSPVVYESSNQSIAQIINGNTVKIVGAGTANIKATIKGTNISKDQSLVVDKANQIITFDIVPVLYKGDAATTMNAYSNKGFPVSITNANPYVVKVSGTMITPVDIGKATVTASAPGNNNYKEASLAQLVEVKSRTGEEITVPLVITPNGDGINDQLIIRGVENFPENHVVIVNRNGTKIFDVYNYDNSETIFLGMAKVNGTFAGKVVGRQEYLPQGTYFYSISYTVGGTSKRKTGYFVLKY